jgi:Family of unknown function (DUF6541)
MFKTTRNYLLLALIFAFAFGYRMLFMHWEGYPPGADIGLHESVVYSIIGHGNVDFFHNFYQMGGGLSLTFPGYHIFVSFIMMMTGMPDYLAHSTVVAFFSSIIVLCAYLIVRFLQGESAALIAAFLVAISRFDIEMLLWGGYPNVITLMFIPLTFYLYLQKERFSLLPFLVTATVFSGTIFLTHSLSAVIFSLTVLGTAILGMIFSKRLEVPRKNFAIWILPLILGALIVSPFLIDAIPAYLSNTLGEDIQQALLSTRILPLELVLPLFVCVPFFFFFSKKYQKRFLTVPSLLLAIWILIPLLFTQGYLVGQYTDYNRFLYYTVLPVIILVALGIDHGSGFFARIADTYLALAKRAQTYISPEARSRLMPRLKRKNLYVGFSLGLLVTAFFTVPIFLTPFQGVKVQSFYQVMNPEEYEAIQWAKQNTPTNSIFVSDALYGWWFSGFAQRRTLSAVDPQYLSLEREFANAEFARYLLDTDYVIDNNFTQVREDGGYIGRHNPMFLTKLNWTYFPYSFLNFNYEEAQIRYRLGESVQSIFLDQLPVIEMYNESDAQHSLIVVKKGNDYLNYTQLITLNQRQFFVNMSIVIESGVDNVFLDWADLTVHSNGKVIGGIPNLKNPNKTVGLLDEGVKAFCQMIFDKDRPENVTNVNDENPCIMTLHYNFQGGSKAEIQILVGTYSVSDDPKIYFNTDYKIQVFNKMILDNLNRPLEGLKNWDVETFDYKSAMENEAISYVANRDSELNVKFANDPAFSLVFINDYVAIFAVKDIRLSGEK